VAEPLIDIEKAAFGYNGDPVIAEVSLHVEEGDFIGLIGPNGAGKSTLFRGMLGLLRPMRGMVRYAPGVRERIGYVPQRDTLEAIYPLTAADVTLMGCIGVLPWYRFPGAVERRRVESALTAVGMQDFSGAAFAELSGGQRQRVLIARALATEPRILVLDEPTAGIDPQAETVILELLRRLHAEENMTILIVTHRVDTHRRFMQRLIHVQDGRVTEEKP
jgi:ABC-type Mn2+/Zn2+ transport system ATPase subunit